MAWVRLRNDIVVGAYGGPQDTAENVTEIADDDPRYLSFISRRLTTPGDMRPLLDATDHTFADDPWRSAIG